MHGNALTVPPQNFDPIAKAARGTQTHGLIADFPLTPSALILNLDNWSPVKYQ